MRRTYKYCVLLVSLISLCLGIVGLAASYDKAPLKDTNNVALLMEVDGAIGPATQDYIKKGLEKAEEDKARVVIIKLDTPGGLETSMRDIIQDIISSPIPVITYVAPGGARAASAGTYILYASHIAAMAPGTNIGAATPVAISPTGDVEGEDKKDAPKPTKSTMMQKAENDAAAYLQSLAELRGRNVPWTQEAVRASASISAETALKEKVIDYIASDLEELLDKANGRTVLVLGDKMILDTQDLVIQIESPDWRSEFLMILTDPNIAYLLLLAGIYGLFFEFVNPGFVLPGVIGAISILLALYAFQLLPVNYAALALILLGIGFLIGEAFFPSGIMATGGIVAFIFGSIMLFDRNVPGFEVAISLILGVAVATAAFFIIIAHVVLKSRLRPVVSGEEQLPQSIGEITKVEKNTTWMRLRGEMWQVKSDEPLKKDQKVIVIRREGLVLYVEPFKENT